nr:hypothetical protein CFP56_72077 [Quercus suber]
MSYRIGNGGMICRGRAATLFCVTFGEEQLQYPSVTPASDFERPKKEVGEARRGWSWRCAGRGENSLFYAREGPAAHTTEDGSDASLRHRLIALSCLHACVHQRNGDLGTLDNARRSPVTCRGRTIRRMLMGSDLLPNRKSQHLRLICTSSPIDLLQVERLKSGDLNHGRPTTLGSSYSSLCASDLYALTPFGKQYQSIPFPSRRTRYKFTWPPSAMLPEMYTTAFGYIANDLRIVTLTSDLVNRVEQALVQSRQ